LLNIKIKIISKKSINTIDKKKAECYFMYIDVSTPLRRVLTTTKKEGGFKDAFG